MKKIYVDGIHLFCKMYFLFKPYVIKSRFSEEFSSFILLIYYKDVKIELICINLFDIELNKINKENDDFIILTESQNIFQYTSEFLNLNKKIIFLNIIGENLDFGNYYDTVFNFLNNGNCIITSNFLKKSDILFPHDLKLKKIIYHENFSQNFYSYFISSKILLGWLFETNDFKWSNEKKFDIAYYERPEYQKIRDKFKREIDKLELKVNRISEIKKQWKNYFGNKKFDYIYEEEGSNMSHIFFSGEGDSSYLFYKFFYDYIDSYMGICFETINTDNDEFYMTEKTFKFLYYGIPFYNVCHIGITEKLNEMGFFSYEMLIRDKNSVGKTLENFKEFFQKYNSTKEIKKLTETHIDKFENNLKLINHYINEKNKYKEELIEFILK